MRTARSSSCLGGSPLGTPPGAGIPFPQDQTHTPRTSPPGADPPKQTPACEPNSWHTLLKILPCPKLRLRAVKISHHAGYRAAVERDADAAYTASFLDDFSRMCVEFNE